MSSVAHHQHTAEVTTLKWSGDGKQFCSGSLDGSIKVRRHQALGSAAAHGISQVWDGVSNRCIGTFIQAHDGAPVCSVAFSRNGKYILSSGKVDTRYYTRPQQSIAICLICLYARTRW